MATYLSQALENSQKVDLVIATYTDTLTALKRDYKTYLSLEEKKLFELNKILMSTITLY